MWDYLLHRGWKSDDKGKLNMEGPGGESVGLSTTQRVNDLMTKAK